MSSPFLLSLQLIFEKTLAVNCYSRVTAPQMLGDTLEMKTPRGLGPQGAGDD
jgi:hypothetical protein